MGNHATPPGEYPPDFFRQLTDNVGVGVAIYDDTGRFRYVNRAYADLLGTDTDAIQGTSLWKYNPEFDGDRFDEYWASFEDGQTRVTETIHRCGDGSTVPIETITTRTRIDGDSYNVGTVKDISARKEWESQLEAERDRFTALFEAVPESVVHVTLSDSGPVVRHVNSSFEAVFGIDEADIRGESLSRHIVPAHLQDEARQLDRIARAGETVEREVRRIAADGVQDFLLRVNPLISGEAGEFVAVYTDISEQKDRERRLADQREQAELLNRIVRHDIRNDMQSIMSRLTLLEDHLEDGHHHLEQVRERSDHIVELTSIVRDLMERLLEEQQSLEAVSLRKPLRSQIDDVSAEYDSATVECPSPVPAVSVRADDMLESVFRNLLTNAIQHNNTAEPTVQVSVTESDYTVEVAIADNGPGIPDARKDDIFGKGEKGLESGGTGIGLYLVRTLVEGYGGDVWVEDRADYQPAADFPAGDDSRGTVFVVELRKTE
ncbi:MAG: PAS domain S-box-containing protein [Haloarculaceae archaeon]|jgi:PAS domain S-box-containing protein